MQDAHRPNGQDMFALLKKVRQQLNVLQEQQHLVDQRLHDFWERQQDLQAQLDILHMEQQYHRMLSQERERKQAAWLRRKARSKRRKATP